MDLHTHNVYIDSLEYVVSIEKERKKYLTWAHEARAPHILIFCVPKIENS